MENFILLIVFITVLVFLITFICIIGLVLNFTSKYKSIYQKYKRHFWGGIVLFLLWGLFLYDYLSIFSSLRCYFFTKDYFGDGYILPKPVFELEDDNADYSTGDGHSIAIYQIDIEEMKLIEKSIFSNNNLPIKRKSMNNWTQTNWVNIINATPEHTQIILNLLTNQDNDNIKKLEKSMLQKNGYYFIATKKYLLPDGKTSILGGLRVVLLDKSNNLICFINSNI